MEFKKVCDELITLQVSISGMFLGAQRLKKNDIQWWNH
jgi:hypothetical protein